jgi:hypothetical protein
MANWDNDANQQFNQIKTDAHATDSQMADLKQQIEAWANQNTDGIMDFPFGQYRATRVQVRMENGWIKSLDYGQD